MGKSRNRDFYDDDGGRYSEDRREKRKKKDRDRDPELELYDPYFDPSTNISTAGNPRRKR